MTWVDHGNSLIIYQTDDAPQVYISINIRFIKYSNVFTTDHVCNVAALADQYSYAYKDRIKFGCCITKIIKLVEVDWILLIHCNFRKFLNFLLKYNQMYNNKTL